MWQLSLQFPSAFEFSEFYLLQLHSLTYASLYGTFVFNSPKICLQVAMLSRHSQFFGSDEGVPDSNETCYEGLLRPAWGHWRDNLTREDREYCHNPLYYIFGNSEARYDFNTSDPLPMYDQFSSIFDDTAPNLVVGGSYGLYNRDSPMKDLHVAGRGKTSHHYQQGLPGRTAARAGGRRRHLGVPSNHGLGSLPGTSQIFRSTLPSRGE